MRVPESCAECLYDKQKHLTDDVKYLSEVKELIDNRDEDDTSPYLVYKFNRVYERYFGKKAPYREIKKKYNDLVLSVEQSVRNRIEASEDPLAKALAYARVGNYIDFGAMNHVDEKTFLDLLDNAQLQDRDAEVIRSFVEQCGNAHRFLLITDNCGEIVLDKLLLKILKEKYPKASYTLMVRGMPVSNDVTREDALQVRVQEVADIMDNGTDIGGTAPNHVPQSVRDFLTKADVIIAKGQGNFETAYGSGWPIYYLFLCKCDLFMRRFGKKKFGGMFVHESRVKDACLM